MADRAAVLRRRETPPSSVGAIIHRAPGSLTDELQVTIPSDDPLAAVEIRFWMPRGAVLPSVGDAALVAFAEDGEPWLVAFSPS